MCVVLPRNLGKGFAARARCIPQAIGASPASSRVSTIGETSLSPNPIDHWACLPLDPSRFQRGKGAFLLPLTP